MIAGLSMLMYACENDFAEEEIVVYSNDLSGSNLANLNGATLWEFEGITLIGPYHNEGFTLSLTNLPKHRIIKVSVDLYVHDSWDGNTRSPDGPDLWFINFDNTRVYETTFSNNVCDPPFCLQQSYPGQYLVSNFPRTGALRTDLPGRCHWSSHPDGTSVYRVEIRIGHKDKSVKIGFFDSLVQPNSPNPFCDESWSVGRIEISTIAIK